jgi:hypothetical protein
LYENFHHSKKIEVLKADSFSISSSCRRIALLGATPNPTFYLKSKDDWFTAISRIILKDFLNEEFLLDSYCRVLNICNEQFVGTVILAFLPSYYADIRYKLKEHFIEGIETFFERIIPQIYSLLEKAIEKTEFKGNIVLALPTEKQLNLMCRSLTDEDENICFFVKQYPHLEDIHKSQLEEIIIITNSGLEAQSKKVVEYLKYEYLFEKDLKYSTYYTGKRRFHENSIC